MCLIKRAVLAAGICAVVLALALRLDPSQMLPLRQMLHQSPMRRQVSPEDQQNLLRAAEMHDANTVRALLKAGADPNRMDQYGSTPLMLAARGGFEDVVEALVEGGASVNVARPNGSTALAEAIEGEHTDVITRLRAAGATSDIVTGENGRPLPAGGGEPMETVRAYLTAVHARDIPGLYAAFVPHDKGLFEGTDFDLWHRIRPQDPIFLEGFTTGSTATLAVGGATISRARYVWHYQLVYMRHEVWRILREWDTTLTKMPTPSPAPPPSPVEPVERPRSH